MKKIAIFMFTLSLIISSAFMDDNKQTQKLPSVSLKNLDGQTINTADFDNDGKPIIISFWATWCKPCVKELKTIADEYEDWQDETGVKIIAIAIDDSKTSSRVKPFVNGQGWEYEVYLDANQDFKRAMNVGDVPHTFILNGDKEIVWQHTTYVPGAEEDMINKVKELVGIE